MAGNALIPASSASLAGGVSTGGSVLPHEARRAVLHALHHTKRSQGTEVTVGAAGERLLGSNRTIIAKRLTSHGLERSGSTGKAEREPGSSGEGARPAGCTLSLSLTGLTRANVAKATLGHARLVVVGADAADPADRDAAGRTVPASRAGVATPGSRLLLVRGRGARGTCRHASRVREGSRLANRAFRLPDTAVRGSDIACFADGSSRLPLEGSGGAGDAGARGPRAVLESA